MKCYCGSTNTVLLGEKKSQVGMVGFPPSYDIYKCQDCGSILTKGYKYSEPFYKHAYHTSFQQGRQCPTYQKRWTHDLKVAGDRINWFDGTLININVMEQDWDTLDVGCGNAAFVALGNTKATNWNSWGIEFNVFVQRANIIRGSFISHDFTKPMTVLGQEMPHRYDMVTAFDVIEHLPNPVDAITKIANLSSQYVFIEQPDPCSADAISQGVEWKHIKPQEHNFLFSEKFVTSLIGTLGFGLIYKGDPVKGRMSLVYRRSE